MPANHAANLQRHARAASYLILRWYFVHNLPRSACFLPKHVRAFLTTVPHEAKHFGASRTAQKNPEHLVRHSGKSYINSSAASSGFLTHRPQVGILPGCIKTGTSLDTFARINSAIGVAIGRNVSVSQDTRSGIMRQQHTQLRPQGITLLGRSVVDGTSLRIDATDVSHMHSMPVVSGHAVGNKQVVEQFYDVSIGTNHIMVAGSRPPTAAKCRKQLFGGDVLRSCRAMHENVLNSSHICSVRDLGLSKKPASVSQPK